MGQQTNQKDILDQEIDNFIEILLASKDRILMILRFHLYVENLLERIIIAKLDKGDRIVENGGLSFFQKIKLADAFNLIEDRIIQSIKKLNTLRNDCVHKLRKRLTQNDIEKIGRPLGKTFTKIKKQYSTNLDNLIQHTFRIIYSHLLAKALNLECPGLFKSK